MSQEAEGPDFDSGQDTLTAVPRGPGSVFLHWELDGRRSAEVGAAPGTEWVVRTLDLSEGTSASMPVDRRAGRCYVTVEPGRTYGFELAVRTAGHWRTICRTERVAIPAARPGVPEADGPGGSSQSRPRVLRGTHPAVGAAVPGLRAETTPLRLGSSPHSPPDGEEAD
jgi:hypothetical protein